MSFIVPNATRQLRGGTAMALVKCKECGVDISDAARVCPKCGIQLQKPKRGVFGFIFKWAFIIFNLFMVYALFAGLYNVGSELQGPMTAGETLGTTIGVTFILMFWALGDVVLGLLVFLTRPK